MRPIGGGQVIDIQSFNKTEHFKIGTLELCYSGGKDSDVILHLANMAGIKYQAIYKNTTIDPPGTEKHARDNNCIVAKPQKTFFELIASNGLPSRFSRFCCSKLKEYKIGEVAIYGIRRDESAKRAERYKEPNFCRVYSKKEKTHVWLPILEWTKDDVAEFVNSEGIKCHELYYDDCGRFHAERRLGCIGCPLQSRKHRLEEFKTYPKFLRRWVIQAQKFVETHMDSPNIQRFNSGANMMFFQLFCDNMEQYNLKTKGMFGDLDCKQYLEDYFKIDLP